MPGRGAGARAVRRAPAAAPGRARACGGASVLAHGASGAETGARRVDPVQESTFLVHRKVRFFSLLHVFVAVVTVE